MLRTAARPGRKRLLRRAASVVTAEFATGSQGIPARSHVDPRPRHSAPLRPCCRESNMTACKPTRCPPAASIPRLRCAAARHADHGPGPGSGRRGLDHQLARVLEVGDPRELVACRGLRRAGADQFMHHPDPPRSSREGHGNAPLSSPVAKSSPAPAGPDPRTAAVESLEGPDRREQPVARRQPERLSTQPGLGLQHLVPHHRPNERRGRRHR